jgi:hypothetical protein
VFPLLAVAPLYESSTAKEGRKETSQERKKMRKALFALLLFASPAFPCGLERWAVKTLQDKDALRVNTTPLLTTVANLNSLTPPSRADLMKAVDYRFAPDELRVWQVTGYLVGFKLETDEDIHIVLADLDDPTKTMVVEIPSEHCMKGEGALQQSWQARFGKATAKFHRVLAHKMKVEVVGYGFFDVIHGQTGVAASGFEIHPMISWKEVP